jgi:hypothetical protein
MKEKDKLQLAFNQSYSLRGTAPNLADKLLAGLKDKNSDLYQAYKAGIERFDLDLAMDRIKDDPDKEHLPEIEPDTFEDYQPN